MNEQDMKRFLEDFEMYEDFLERAKDYLDRHKIKETAYG